ncbi:site-specific DNA-methyltransferase [Paenibacillus sp. CGMCC 1.16610]|nr:MULTISPECIES: site-specific DNA-methyltransferase [Paenibacillus]MBA2943199.1 site-specific DNA-methyltransferase [Paenibacillus sp. CGMCC 1.16610]
MFERNHIYNEDCILGMRNRLPDESVDMILSDPPYLINYHSQQDRFEGILNDGGNDGGFITDYFEQCYRVLKPNSSVFIFCSWHKIDFFKQQFEKFFTMKNLIVWVKNVHGAGDTKGSFAPKHELLLYGHKGRSHLRGYRLSDVIQYPKIPGLSLVHPTEKPVGMLEKLITAGSDSGHLILDGCMGSGATASACIRTNRDYVGWELDPNHYATCIHRTNNYQETLFLDGE